MWKWLEKLSGEKHTTFYGTIKKEWKTTTTKILCHLLMIQRCVQKKILERHLNWWLKRENVWLVSQSRMSIPLTLSSLMSAGVWWTGPWWHGGETGEGRSSERSAGTLVERNAAENHQRCSELQGEDLVLRFSSGCAWGDVWPNAAVPSGSQSAGVGLWRWTHRSSLGRIYNVKMKSSKDGN